MDSKELSAAICFLQECDIEPGLGRPQAMASGELHRALDLVCLGDVPTAKTRAYVAAALAELERVVPAELRARPGYYHYELCSLAHRYVHVTPEPAARTDGGRPHS